MALSIISREDWGALDPEHPPTPWKVSDLFGVTVHHFASPRSASTKAGSAALMRAVQRVHQAGEFNDIAYNFCFDKFGQVFEARGWNIQTAANGTSFANDHYLSISYMGHTDQDGFPEVAQDAGAALLAAGFRRGIDRRVVPHRKWTGTACPGDRGHAWVVGGGWKADLPRPTRVKFELWDDAIKVDESIASPISESRERWKLFSERVRGQAHNHMAREGALGSVQFRRRILN